MSRRHVATADQMRAQAAKVAATMTGASVGRAQVGDATTALACQWVADVNRVAAALWNQAGVTPDPHGAFFDLAERVLTAASPADVAAGAPASVLLAEVRTAFRQACAAMNIPLLFLPATHLATLYTPVDLRAMREQILRGTDEAGFVEGRLSQARQTTGPGALRLALDAYLVDVAARAGDQLLLTAAARMIALAVAAPPDTADMAQVSAAAQMLLGPVEWVRARPYLARAGLA